MRWDVRGEVNGFHVDHKKIQGHEKRQHSGDNGRAKWRTGDDWATGIQGLIYEQTKIDLRVGEN